MKTLLLSLTILIGTNINSTFQSQPKYQSLDLGFTGVYDLSKNIITPELAKRAQKELGLKNMEKYEFIANESNGYILAGLVLKGEKWDKATVVFKNNEIVQTELSKSLLDKAIVEKMRQTAISNGLKKDESDFGLFRFEQGNLVWFELGGTIDGVFGHMIIDENGNFISKKSFDH